MKFMSFNKKRFPPPSPCYGLYIGGPKFSLPGFVRVGIFNEYLTAHRLGATGFTSPSSDDGVSKVSDPPNRNPKGPN